MKKNKKRNTKKSRKHIKKSTPAIAGNVFPSVVSGINFNKGPAIYRQNMQALQKRYPELARQITDTPVTGYKIVPSATGLPNLFIPGQNTHYYDPAEPWKDVGEQLAALKLKNTRLAIFLGLGLGYEIIYFAQNMAKEQNTSYLLIIEKDLQVLKTALNTTNLVSLLENPNIHFLVGLPPENLYVEIRNYLAENSRFMLLKAMKPVYHLSALKLHKEYYLGALKQLRESGAHQVLHYGNDPHDSLIGVENMLENLHEIVFNPGINLLFRRFQGKPAIVVSTGPSLNKNKHLLKGLEDKALIISVDASLKILLEMDVKPHLVTSLERVPAVVKLIEGIKKEEVDDVYFAACPVVRNSVYKTYPGPRIIVYRNFDHFKWLGIDRGILHIQLSSGNMAFKIAQALGCDPIILIGQDLAFSRDGYTHARGTALGDKQDNVLQDGIFETVGNDGQPILTTSTWYSFLKAYEVDVAGYDGTCINSTEGGAYINGTTVMTFQEAIDRHVRDSFCPLEIIKDNISTFTTERAQEDLRSALRLIAETTADLRGIMENCTQGLELLNQYKEELQVCLSDVERLDSYRGKLQRIRGETLAPKQKCIQHYHKTFQLFFMHIFQSFNIKFEMDMIAVPEKHDDADAATVEILLCHREWYSVVAELVQICLDALHKAEDNLQQKMPTESAC